MRKLLALALFLFLPLPAQAQTTVYPPYPVPIPATQGGLGGAVVAPTHYVVTFGASWSASGGPNTSCSEAFNTPTANPTGNCYADVLAQHYNVPILNLGLAGTCAGTYGAGNYCALEGNAGITRYTSQLTANCIPSNLVVFDYQGINDIYHQDAGFTLASFQFQIDQQIAACVNNGTHNIVVLNSPYLPVLNMPAQQSVLFGSDGVMAQEAVKWALPLADVYAGLTPCWVDAYPTPATPCSTDGLHPNVAGNAALAALIESATFTSSIQAQFFNDLYGYSAQQASFGTILAQAINVQTIYLPNSTSPYIDLAVGLGSLTSGGTGSSAYAQMNLSGTGTTTYWSGATQSVGGITSDCSTFGQYGGAHTILGLACNGNVGVYGSVSSGGSTYLLNGSAGSANTVLTSNGTSDTWNNAPAISGANIASGTIPNAALATPVPAQTCAAWTPTDQSGASLSYTSASGYYCKTGRQATVQSDITYPTNASAAAAAWSLPIAATATNQQLCSVYNTATLYAVSLSGGGTTATLVTLASPVTVANSALGGVRLILTCSYITT